MFDVAFDQVVSIGSACDCAMLLNDVKLRMTSGPFDWVAGSSFAQRINLLKRRFEGFMIRENVVWQEEGRYDRANDVYRDKSLGFVFIHDFPKGIGLDASFPLVRDKYMRRITRLLKRLDDGWTTCFVWRSWEGSVPVQECEKAAAALRLAFPNATCRILLLENDATTPLGRLEFESYASGACVKARGFFVSTDENPMGDRCIQWKALRMLRCSPALAQQRLRFRIVRGIVRFVTIWHLTHGARKLARKRWMQRLYRTNAEKNVGW